MAKVLLFLFLALAPFAAHAQEIKKYNYESITLKIQVNEDTSFDVEESQVFDFRQGQFHVAFRRIPFDKIDTITDISVFDGATGQPLVYSRGKLDKNSPSSWGKYTHYRSEGSQYIEWYYDLANTKHEWILKYKVHGGIEFRRDHDRLYWDIFTDYDVPIDRVTATVALPEHIQQSDARVYAYRTSEAPIAMGFSPGQQFFEFEATDFTSFEDFTIDIGWPKGIVDPAAYWQWFFRQNYGYIFGFLSVILAFLIALGFWIKNEKWQKGRPSIAPQYEPPMNLRPAMAEIITKEKLTGKGLAATVVDLAVRGYVKIEEESETTLGKVLRIAVRLLVGIFCLIFIGSIFSDLAFKAGIWALVFLVPAAAIMTVGILKLYGSKLKPVDYKIIKLKDFENDAALEGYEVKYLKALFSGTHYFGGQLQEYFSTKEMKKAPDSEKRRFALKIQELKKKILKETESDTKAFEIKPSNEVFKIAGLIFVAFVGYAGLMILVGNQVNQLIILLFLVALSSFGLWVFIKYEARLNQEGRILRDDWLGFKKYLEVAEKYRLQNLTPELFEKYLPYAIVFGVEKKWANAFEGMHLPPPQWYGSASGAYVASGGLSGPSSAGGFSPSAFSSSFASSFASSFSTSSGGGGAGGGGAGGGGGGGGGGAG